MLSSVHSSANFDCTGGCTYYSYATCHLLLLVLLLLLLPPQMLLLHQCFFQVNLMPKFFDAIHILGIKDETFCSQPGKRPTTEDPGQLCLLAYALLDVHYQHVISPIYIRITSIAALHHPTLSGPQAARKQSIVRRLTRNDVLHSPRIVLWEVPPTT